MGNKQNQPVPLSDQISSFDPLIFPQAMQETEALRKKLFIGRNFKKLPNPEDIPQKVQDFLNAGRAGNADLVNSMLKEDPSLINATNSKLRTLLHQAVLGAQFDLAASLLLNPNIAVNAQDLNGRTPLILGCFYGFPDKGSKLEVKTAPLRAGTDYAQKMKAIILLLSSDPRVDLDIRDWWKRTALIYCANSALFPQLSVMIERGANLNLKDVNSATALHYACKVGDTNSARTLVDANALMEVQDQNGWRPIHFAAASTTFCFGSSDSFDQDNHLEIVKFLKARNAQYNALTFSNQTPAQLSNSLDVIWLLEDRFTCETHPYQIDFCDKVKPVAAFGKARVGMAMCPGRNKKNWRRHLDRDIQVILREKIQTVVTLVQNDELISMGIPNLIPELEKVGVKSIHYEIHDKWIPSEMLDLVDCVNKVVAEIKAERTIMVHCNGGKGRTGLIVVAAMMALGMDQDEATNHIREARPGMIYNPAQILYLHAYKKYLNEQALLQQQNQNQISNPNSY